MKLRSKETYWLLKNGLMNTYPSLQHDIDCDVLIIGSGITGALMAYQLSGEGYHAVVVDKRDVAMGSTAATTALLQYEIDAPLYKLIDSAGEAVAVDSYREGVTAIERLEEIVQKVRAPCDFSKKQSLYVAATEEDVEWLHQEFLCRSKYNLQVSWLNRTQLKEKFGIRGKGAIFSDHGASLDAYCLAHTLLAYSVKHFRVSVFDHTHAEHIEYGKTANVIHTDAGRKITCQHIVYATGYEAHAVLKNKIVDLNSTYAFVSEPLSGISPALKDVIFWNTEDPYLYMRVTEDDRILVGGGDEKFENALRRDTLIDKKENFLLGRIQSVLPGVPLIPDFSWAGTFGVTKDALPYIGAHPDFPNSFFVLGFGGNGITFSVMGMRIISDALADRPNKFLDYYRFNR